MGLRHQFLLGAAGALTLGIGWVTAANAQAALHPIPAAECQAFAVQVQNAIGMAAKASEDDFTDLTDRSEDARAISPPAPRAKPSPGRGS